MQILPHQLPCTFGTTCLSLFTLESRGRAAYTETHPKRDTYIAILMTKKCSSLVCNESRFNHTTVCTFVAPYGPHLKPSMPYESTKVVQSLFEEGVRGLKQLNLIQTFRKVEHNHKTSSSCVC